ncbi:MAG TPA: arsenic resistance N-acetyltransferase ArsN2 [Telluria sp.]|nr:arsenic resistance N-acetyltransferase ArsN2 [Telluria sp.]
MTTTPQLLRDVVRRFVRDQRRSASCGDSGATVRCHLLTELLHGGPAPQQQLAARLMLDKGWISRAAAALEAAGQITRRPSPHDRRSTLLELTAAGRSAAARLDASLDQHAAGLLAALGPAQEAAFAEGLRHVLHTLGGASDMPRTAAPALYIRPALETDWPAVAALLEQAGLPAPPAPPPDTLLLVAQDETAVRGAIGLQVAADAALVRSLVVADGWRGAGAGAALLAQLLAHARRRGVRSLYLLTTTAAPFFARHGFEPAARDDVPAAVRSLDQFQGVCPASAAVMWRLLDPPCPPSCP